MSDKLEPLAIVGMKWRFSGEANSASGFWDVLTNARSAKSRIQADRFNVDAHYHPSADRNGSDSAGMPIESVAGNQSTSVSQQNDGHLQSTESKLVVAWLAALLETEIHTMSRTCQLVVVPACWRPDLS
ncbi:hypothetical protein V6Z92_009469 [Aspergillus fumigatus]